MKKDPLPGTSSAKVNLRLLELFAAVAEEGTMSAAAVRLEMSQAAVSQAITLLEEALGVALFDRSVRPPALTLLGTSAVRCTKEIFAKLRELEDTMRHGESGRVPLLRIGMLDSFTSTAGAAMLEQLKDVAREWTVVSGFKATSLEALVERRADAIITSEDRAIPEGVQAQPILGEAFMLAVPMRYKGDLGSMRAVASELDFIRYGRDSHMGSVIEGYLKRAGLHPVPRYQFDTTDAALRMVAAGFGWTIVTPLIFLKSMVPSKVVRVVPLPGKEIRRTLLVAMRRNESGEILHRIRGAALGALREVVLPQISALSLPDYADRFVISSDGPVKRRRKR
jgi:DNA-binding transcriptional LysR family regulator